MKPNKCQGLCCERFVLYTSHAKLDTASIGDIYDLVLRVREGDKPAGYEEAEAVYEMLLPLGNFSVDPLGNKAGSAYHHTCRHFDRIKGRCKIYELRPSMCSRYPNNDMCEFAGVYFNKKQLEREEEMARDECCSKEEVKKEVKEDWGKKALKQCLERDREDEICVDSIRKVIEDSNIDDTHKSFLMRKMKRYVDPDQAFTLEMRPIQNGYLIRTFSKQTLGSEPLEYAITGKSALLQTLASIFFSLTMEFDHLPSSLVRVMNELLEKED